MGDKCKTVQRYVCRINTKILKQFKNAMLFNVAFFYPIIFDKTNKKET